jgi:hypothetical protein
MATCFGSIESSSGLPENRSNVSKFIVQSWPGDDLIESKHSAIRTFCAFWDSTINFDTLDLFSGRPGNYSIEPKHVAIRIFCVINCCI